MITIIMMMFNPHYYRLYEVSYIILTYILLCLIPDIMTTAKAAANPMNAVVKVTTSKNMDSPLLYSSQVKQLGIQTLEPFSRKKSSLHSRTVTSVLFGFSSITKTTINTSEKCYHYT